MTLARRPAVEGGFSTLRRSRKPTKRQADPVTPEVYAEVMLRDRACVASTLFGRACGGREVWHHRLPLEYGGRSTVSNGVRLCSVHHHRVHTARHLAQSAGLLLRRGQEPSQVPLTLWSGKTVLLNEAGGYQEVGDDGSG